MLAADASAQRPRTELPIKATRSVYLDGQGVIRWKDDRSEVALFGANYIVPSASDYRAAGYVTKDRKKIIDDDMAHFARMGWDGMRLTLWGDWENSDRAGNLIANDHLDLMDYLIARARERGIYMLLSPIQTYNAGWPDALGDTTSPGFSNHFQKGELGTNPAAIAAQANYITQLLEHVNPYTGTRIKDEPAILFIEMINEPTHHSADLDGSVRYINTLVDAVRRTGCEKILFHNVSQDFGIAEAIKRSKVQGASFGWYPTGLNSGHELQGNYLRTVDSYERMLTPALAGRPRIVYEFDSPDLRTGYMYPAMARAFRSVGTQFVAMFAYDMLATSSRNLGWQTHYLNLVYTPRKAMSAIIAAEAMRRLPRMRSYGAYPGNTRFGDFRVSYEENLGELVAADAYLNAGTTPSPAPHPAELRRVAGYGSSPVVGYDGEGIYFVDKLRDGVWRLEVYADAVPVRDPFEMQSPDKIVTRAIARAWPMQIKLPDLGDSFTVTPLAGGGAKAIQLASTGRFTVTPGVYLLSAHGSVDQKTLPAYVGHLGLAEYHPPPVDSLPPQVEPIAAGEYLTNQPVEIRSRVVTTASPSAVTLSIRTVGSGGFRRFAMMHAGGYEYRVVIPDSLREGLYEYAITVASGGGDSVTTFPGGLHKRPWDWDFYGSSFWKTRVVRPATPLPLFEPEHDTQRLAFTRIGDAGRRGIYRIVPSLRSGTPAFHLERPVLGSNSPEDYTASLIIRDRIGARKANLANAKSLTVRARGLGPRQLLHVTLVEQDGTSWSSTLSLDSAWTERSLPLAELKPARSVTLPAGFPGIWNYWVTPAVGRGGQGDALRLADVERLQLSLRKEDGVAASAAPYGVEIESVRLNFQRSTDIAIDATGQPAPAETGFLKFGSTRSPDGHTIEATSRYLTRDGKPWLPVMGEFHFSRYPEAEWEQELEKMKAGGVSIVSSYIIWIYHEEVEGKFDWSGQRNLRRFVELCAKHGLLFYARPGPWVHAETRNGGFPDWLVARVGTRLRSNDSTYLASVARFYGEVGRQLHGVLWKDGGPVIGVQLENEYNNRGPRGGAAHIATLKTMARDAGLDVPLYTVTGWDNAIWPPAEVIPVFGGYPDMPWDASITTLPPNEVYGFRFENRANGGFQARWPNGTPNESAEDALSRYPNLGAEYGGAIQVTYHRRPLIESDDIAAMLPVQLGSGVNMYGYYMFHGGAHLRGALSTLQESQRTGYPTDVPVMSYDFQAPLSQYGEMRETFRRTKPVHYFLQAFGEELAPMVPRRPSVVPAGLGDTTTPRIAARTLGDRGYIFFNNYLRGHHMSEHTVRVALQLPGETLHVPSVPIKVASGAYGIWPVNTRIGSALLKYSTAQLVTRTAGDVPVYVFFAIPGVAPEFAFDTAGTVRVNVRVNAPGARIVREGGRVIVRQLQPGTGVAVTIDAADGTRARIVLLTREQAGNLWSARVGGTDLLLLSPQEVFFDASRIHLLAKGAPTFSLSTYPALPTTARGATTLLRREGQDGLFTRYSATLPAHRVSLDVRKVRDAALVPPVKKMNAVTWRKEEIALAPSDSAFDQAALWRIEVKPEALERLSNIFLEINYVGDVARLYSGDELLDDDFFKGTSWRVGLRRMAPALARGPLELRVLPLRSDAPIFLQGGTPRFPAAGQVAEVSEIRVIPEYELVIDTRARRP